MKKSSFLLFLVCFFISDCFSLNQAQKDFIKSFVTHYDFSPEGRYTHEYHPFLLEKTRASLKQLEDHLQQSGFGCKGRVVVMGYQQEGVASYYPSFSAAILTDEASLSGKRGRVVPAHNIFGFLTGFLLKDANWLQKNWYPHKPLLVEHILPERVDLFDDHAYIFQKHAFGKDFEVLLQKRDTVEKSIKTGSAHKILEELISFWQRIYNGELKSSAQEVIATSDILFSIDYAKHLCDSFIPVSKIYVGPDITYPIEVLSFQEQAATQAAQYFVRLFSSTLQPQEGKKTAYIFCSFVDGVGKSTLLGNVINWKKHGDAIERYERVDNSSSQKGVLYEYEKDVFIMDLPAQLSHWVSKPDGHVFIDTACVSGISAEYTDALTEYVQKHVKHLEKAFNDNVSQYKKEGKKPEGALGIYLENYVTGQSREPWIPFVYEGQVALFNAENLVDIRLLVPLEGAHSKGLKIAQPEQMLFTKGLMIPLRFEVFADDVVSQFKKAGVENIVFIDFLSMYPRSSRETVRVNFLLQYLKKVYKDIFSVEKSLYRSFVNREVELYHLLLAYKNDFVMSLALEAVARASLYSIFTQKSSDHLTLITRDQAFDYLKESTEQFLQESGDFLFETVLAKIESEQNVLRRYAFDKKYEIFVRFSFTPLYAFSLFMENLFRDRFDTADFSDLWFGIDGEFFKQHSHESVGVALRPLYGVSHACRDSVTLTPVFSTVRGHWYVALANLLKSEESMPGRFHAEEASFFAPPLSIKKGQQQTAVVVQKQFDISDEKVPYDVKNNLFLFNNYGGYQDSCWQVYKDTPYCVEWKNTETFYGIYAFGYLSNKFPYLNKIVGDLRGMRIKEGYEDPAVFSTELVSALDATQAWQLVGGVPSNSTQFVGHNSAKKNKKISVHSPRGRAIGLWVRAIATLEMIIKDPHAVIITRKGVQSDFIATMRLLEKVTLPRYFGIQLDKPLFADYSKVDPVIPWELVRQ